MKILVDSSTLYSALVYTGKISELIDILIEEHTIIITDYIVKELKRNIYQKLTKRREKAMEKLTIFTLNCQIKKKEEYIQNIFEAKKMISDKDAPILACGMLPDIDYLITSDKEFFEVKSDKITILSPRKARKKLL